MNLFHRTAVTLGLVAGMGVLAPSAHAGLWDKRTTISFSKAVEVPGTVLEPGKYVMRLVDIPSNRQVVQIMNERESHLYATVMTLPIYRERPAEKTIISFYEEAPFGQPVPVKAWFYPGDNLGREFVYPRDRAVQIALFSRQSVPIVTAGRIERTEGANAAADVPALPEVAVATPAPAAVEQPAVDQAIVERREEARVEEPVLIAQATPPAEPVISDSASSTDLDQGTHPQLPQSLPKTASDFGVIVVVGLVAVAGAGMVRILRQQFN